MLRAPCSVLPLTKQPVFDQCPDRVSRGSLTAGDCGNENGSVRKVGTGTGGKKSSWLVLRG